MRRILACTVLCLGLPAAGLAQGEIFIPGDTADPIIQRAPQPATSLGKCMLNASAANCGDVGRDDNGVQFESAVVPDYETLVFDPTAGTVKVTKAPPPTPPAYDPPKPVDTYQDPKPGTDYVAPKDDYVAPKPVARPPRDYAQKPDPTYTPPPKPVALPSVAVTIEFDYNSDQVRAGEFFKVNELIAALSDPALEGTAFAVIGHTDGAGSDQYNCDLSLRRAASVTRLLEGSYVPIALYPVGFGEHVLKNEYDPRAPENRRVAFLRLPHDARAVLQTAGAVCRY